MHIPAEQTSMIWHLIDSSSVGGAERYIGNACASLARRGLTTEVLLYQRHGENPWLRQLDQSGVRARVLPGTFNGLLRAMRRERPQIVHTHGYKCGILGRLACLAARVPSVSTFHSGERASYPVCLYDWVDEYTSIFSHRIAVSEAVQRRLPYRSTLLVNYVDVPEPARAEPLARRIGFVGRLSDEKWPQFFCDMARQMPEAGEWHVYGDGRLRQSLEKQYGDLVRFHGVVTDMRPVWQELGLLIMPSRFEGLPLAGLEALAASVPILGSRVGGVPQVVREGVTGWLFEPGNMSGALNGLKLWTELGACEQQRMRLNCHQHVMQNFSESVHIEGLMEVYRRAGLCGQ